MKRERPKPPVNAHDEESRNVLREIYQSNGESSDLRKLDSRPKRSKKRRIIILLSFAVVAAIIALIGMSVFSPKDEFAGDEVKLVFDAPEQAGSGEEYVLTLSLQNTGAVGLTNTEITVRYPEGFEFLSATPKASNEFSNAWDVGSVDARETTSIRIVGKLIGERGIEKTFSATASYSPANFASAFTSEGTHTVAITTSALTLEVKSPHAVISGGDVAYTLTITNTGDEAVEHVRMDAEYPEGLADITAEPKASEGTRDWDIGTIEAQATSTVEIRGKLSGTPNTVTELKVRAGVLDQNSAFLVQRESSALVLILEPTLNLTITTDGEASGHAVAPKDEVPVTIAYANDSDSDFSNATIVLTFAGKDSDGATVALVDPNAVTSETSFTASDDEAKMSWTKDEIEGLGRLVPGAKGTIDVTLPIQSNVRSLGSGMNFTLSVAATISATVGAAGGAYEATSETLTFPVTTEIRLSAEGRYYSDEGATLGSGPLPPEVGTTTTYVISWFLTNTLNGANDVLLKTKLPEHVTFVSAESSGGNSITFDATSREVRWRISKVDARVGQTLPTLVGTFRVSLTPVASDLGTTPTLIESSKLTGTDAFSAAALTASATGITTALPSDTLAKDKGVVVEPVATNTNTNTGT